MNNDIEYDYKNNSPAAQRIRLDFAPGESCHASFKDGECIWNRCPQEKDYQSHCPLDRVDDDD